LHLVSFSVEFISENMKLRSSFIYNKTQRKELLILATVVFCGLAMSFYIDFESEDTLKLNSPRIVAIKQAIDSMNKKTEDNSPTIFPFNPNFITDYKGYTLGMTPEEIDRLLTYRSENKWINSAEDFQSVTQVSDSLLAVISPYFKFPEWVKNPQNTPSPNKFNKPQLIEKSFEAKIDLNKATAEELEQVRGIGKVLSNRIIEYRTRLGGFHSDSQLSDVYGLQEETLQRLFLSFTVKTPIEIQKINVNEASASDFSTLPGISFELGKKMWEFRRLRQRIDSITEFKKVDGMTEAKFRQIQLYLLVE